MLTGEEDCVEVLLPDEELLEESVYLSADSISTRSSESSLLWV